MAESRKIRSTIYGAYNALVTGVVKDDSGVVWAIDIFNIYSKRHECMNLHEAYAFNSVEEISAIVSNILSEV